MLVITVIGQVRGEIMLIEASKLKKLPIFLL